ncbi:MAG: mannose-1-phosphate guanylyltransferase/mannose-6-phosphate isomerase [Elusimicrobiota bacterium]
MKAIILAGGSGTRLWPLSRYGLPKQFAPIHQGKSLLLKTVERLCDYLKYEDIYVITNEDYKFHVIEELKKVSINLENNIILEPAGRNTAPAIALSIKFFMEKIKCSASEPVFVCPSDHIIEPVKKFTENLMLCEKLAQEGKIVTFGIKPKEPNTGYGYIKKGKPLKNFKKSFEVEKFVEKPDINTAVKYLKSGLYYWNSGMFGFTMDTMIKEFKKYSPELSKKLNLSYEKMLSSFKEMPNISIDYAVMEKTSRSAVTEADILWSDLGAWDSLEEIEPKDENGNIRIGNVVEINSKNSIFYAQDRLVSAIDAQDLIVVDTKDALLIAKRGSSQKVKEMVNILKQRKSKEVMEHTTVFRPWGSYTVLEEGLRYKIKRITVKPGEKLSIQMHHHRSEHWIVVKGVAKVTNGDSVKLVHENESTYVPKSVKHRLENPGKVPLELIEVQNGEYVGEDDIIRFEDQYGRK